MAFDRNAAAVKLADLAKVGIHIGTSSWKYAGWRGRLYDEARYVWRGKFAESRFEKNCLTEYSEVFHAVGVDSTFYAFPKEESLEGLASLSFCGLFSPTNLRVRITHPFLRKCYDQ